MTEVEILPRISKTEKRISKTGVVILERTLTVQGHDLKECTEIFDERWKKKK